MDPLLTTMLVILVGFVIVWWWLDRRRRATLKSARERQDEGMPETFDRSMLVSRPRTYDPSAWDNTPDAAPAKAAKPPKAAKAPKSKSKVPEPPPGPAGPPVDSDGVPVVLDRAFLEARRRPQPSEPADVPTEAGNPPAE